MTNEELAKVDNQVRKVCGSNYAEVASLMDGLEYNHPQTKPHYYISLLAVKRSSRGKCVTGDLLNTLQLDKDNFPCYGECTRFSTRTLVRRWGYFDAGPPFRINGLPEFYPVWCEHQ